MTVSTGTSKEQSEISRLGRALVPKCRERVNVQELQKKSNLGWATLAVYSFSHLSCYIPYQLLTGERGIITTASSCLMHVEWTHTGLTAATHAMTLSYSQEFQSLLAGQKGSVPSGSSQWDHGWLTHLRSISLGFLATYCSTRSFRSVLRMSVKYSSFPCSDTVSNDAT